MNEQITISTRTTIKTSIIFWVEMILNDKQEWAREYAELISSELDRYAKIEWI